MNEAAGESEAVLWGFNPWQGLRATPCRPPHHPASRRVAVRGPSSEGICRRPRLHNLDFTSRIIQHTPDAEPSELGPVPLHRPDAGPSDHRPHTAGGIDAGETLESIAPIGLRWLRNVPSSQPLKTSARFSAVAKRPIHSKRRSASAAAILLRVAWFSGPNRCSRNRSRALASPCCQTLGDLVRTYPKVSDSLGKLRTAGPPGGGPIQRGDF